MFFVEKSNRYPKELFLAVHDVRRLLEHLADAAEWEGHLRKIKASPISVGAPLRVRITDQNKNVRDVDVWLVDTRLLGVEKDQIDELSKQMEEVPTRIPEFGRWKKLHDEDSEVFDSLAVRAAITTAEYACQFARFSGILSGRYTLPLTVGKLAEDFALQRLGDGANGHLALLGKEVLKPGTSGVSKQTAKLIVNLFEESVLASEAYAGGRNESFYFGISDEAEWRDDDLCSAYPTVLGAIGRPLWERGFQTTDADDFEGDVIGVARVDFRFPKGVRFPTLSVRVDEKLIFPSEGQSYATAPEISLARRLGATIAIKKGFVVPLDQSKRPFEAMITELVRLREKTHFEGNHFNEKMAKRVANSIPGKMGQGLPQKRDSLQKKATVDECELTQPFLAGHVTGTVRAIMGEILNGLPDQVKVLSVTTDGFVSNATEAEIESATSGPLCQAFAKSRERLCGDPTILRTKKRASQLLCVRNRVMATLKKASGGEDLILSRSGIITPGNRRTDDEKNRWLIDQFLDRVPGKLIQQKGFSGGAESVRKVSLDFDFDRRPACPREREFKGRPHVSFNTRPWQTKEDYHAAAEALDEFQRKRCLKTLGDLDDLNELIEAKRSAVRNPSVDGVSTIDGALERAKTQFLRALKKGECGLAGCMNGKTHQTMAKEIDDALQASSLGKRIKVASNDLGRAGRATSQVAPHSVSRTPRAKQFMEEMRKLFPGFPPEDLLAPDHEEFVQNPESETYEKSQEFVGLYHAVSLRKALELNRFNVMCHFLR